MRALFQEDHVPKPTTPPMKGETGKISTLLPHSPLLFLSPFFLRLIFSNRQRAVEKSYTLLGLADGDLSSAVKTIVESRVHSNWTRNRSISWLFRAHPRRAPSGTRVSVRRVIDPTYLDYVSVFFLGTLILLPRLNSAMLLGWGGTSRFVWLYKCPNSLKAHLLPRTL